MRTVRSGQCYFDLKATSLNFMRLSESLEPHSQSLLSRSCILIVFSQYSIAGVTAAFVKKQYFTFILYYESWTLVCNESFVFRRRATSQ